MDRSFAGSLSHLRNAAQGGLRVTQVARHNGKRGRANIKLALALAAVALAFYGLVLMMYQN